MLEMLAFCVSGGTGTVRELKDQMRGLHATIILIRVLLERSTASQDASEN